jgi:hypothetical protein
MTPEGKIKQSVKKLLNEYKCIFWFMPQSGIYGKNGAADFICCVDGWYVEIETKAPGEKQRLSQVARERDVVRSGGRYVLVDGDESLEKLGMIIDDLIYD